MKDLEEKRSYVFKNTFPQFFSCFPLHLFLSSYVDETKTHGKEVSEGKHGCI